ncbi:UPF0280 family protein [Defluviimonas sp. WL0024]|uniref:UPF0280 family protein n=1 Tax=Albidovulum salinarum TaxID=2984153 RepID=A0ABT2WZC5_9RHOB|nr:UPF0280 family protein [Defluviimonas sp. WL0024]MCU9847028.1 UPF0280 family protein [Defluviimonas sp. WL0024]
MISGSGANRAVPAREGPWASRGADRGRLRLTHGPIDVILDLAGPQATVAAAERRAARAFEGLLEALVAELAILRAPAGPGQPLPEGPVARAMTAAVAPFAAWFVTPMAAVAGAVADHLLAALWAEPGLTRAAVNNGGDIALRLGAGERYRIGISSGPQTASRPALIKIGAGEGIGGIATSGWRGRSHSLGIADAVTVLAATAAEADAAATMIANAVDLPGSARVTRRRARAVAPDSDLGDRLVTVAVAALSADERAQALDAGAARARAVIAMGRARAVFLALQGDSRAVGKVTETREVP